LIYFLDDEPIAIMLDFVKPVRPAGTLVAQLQIWSPDMFVEVFDVLGVHVQYWMPIALAIIVVGVLIGARARGG
jgi:hypothetical protein